MSEDAAGPARGADAHATDDDGTEAAAELNLPVSFAVGLVLSAALVVTARTSAVALLSAVAAVQALLGVAWVFGTALPGRRGALLIGGAAAAGSDVAVSIWPHSRLGTLLVVFALAAPLMFVHQLSRGAARVRVVESLSGIAVLVVVESSLAAFIQLRHEFVPPAAGGHVVAGVIEAAGGALIVGYLVDMIMPIPRFDARVPRGLLAVVAAAGLGGSVGHLAITNGADFQGARGAFAGAALGAIVGLFAVAGALLQFSAPLPEGRFGRRMRMVSDAALPLALCAPVAFLLLLAIRV